MTRNEEIMALRQEITRLKVRLYELDKTEEPTSLVCGHDVVLEHLRKLTQQQGAKALAQLACFDTKHGWYTTNIEPTKLRPLLEDGATVRDFLSLFCREGVWEVLEGAYHGEDLNGYEKERELLTEKGLLGDKGLTLDGFTSYVVIGHLAFNQTKKLAVPKAIEIFKIVYELTGLHYGEKLPYSDEEFLELLAGHKDFKSLADHQITRDDLIKYLHQANV